MLPTFIHVGAAKVASTWLWRVCQEHPNIYVPEAKPVNFFVADYARGLDWYQETYYSGWNGEKAIGDLSNGYQVHEPALRRIAKDLPDAELTILLRNPIERGYLQWAHWEQRGLRPEQKLYFERIFENEGWLVLQAWLGPSFYALHLNMMYRHIPKERIHVFWYDDLVANPEGFLEAYFILLGVDPGFQPSMLHKRIGFPSQDHPETEVLKNGMSAETHARLVEIFAEDVAELQEMTGRDLSAWLS